MHVPCLPRAMAALRITKPNGEELTVDYESTETAAGRIICFGFFLREGP